MSTDRVSAIAQAARAYIDAHPGTSTTGLLAAVDPGPDSTRLQTISVLHALARSHGYGQAGDLRWYSRDAHPEIAAHSEQDTGGPWVDRFAAARMEFDQTIAANRSLGAMNPVTLMLMEDAGMLVRGSDVRYGAQPAGIRTEAAFEVVGHRDATCSLHHLHREAPIVRRLHLAVVEEREAPDLWARSYGDTDRTVTALRAVDQHGVEWTREWDGRTGEDHDPWLSAGRTAWREERIPGRSRGLIYEGDDVGHGAP